MYTDLDDAISSAPAVDEGSVQTLVSFGFHEDLARKALKASVRFWSFTFYRSEKRHL
jgi:hypothetical protein